MQSGIPLHATAINVRASLKQSAYHFHMSFVAGDHQARVLVPGMHSHVHFVKVRHRSYYDATTVALHLANALEPWRPSNCWGKIFCRKPKLKKQRRRFFHWTKTSTIFPLTEKEMGFEFLAHQGNHNNRAFLQRIYFSTTTTGSIRKQRRGFL